jgi:MFS family permease
VSAPARFHALRSRNFRLLWIGLLISHTGTWMASVGMSWTIYTVTGSPLFLGLNSLAFAGPAILLPMLGGVVADRVDRLRLLKTAQSGMLLGALTMAVLAHAGRLTVWTIIALNFLEAVFLAFENPSRHALIPDLVEPPALLSAVALAGASYPSAAFIGPALAGLILGAVGAPRVYILFYLNALSFAVVLGMLSALRRVPARPAAPRGSVGRSLVEGLRYVWGAPETRTAILLAWVASAFGRSYTTLMPVFARDILAVGARGLGFLLAAPGAGAIVGSLLLAAAGELRHKGRFVVAAGLVFSGALAAFTISRRMSLALLLLFVAGATSSTTGATVAAMLQQTTPPALRGRVLSLLTMSFIGLPSLGGMAVAAAAAAVGTPAAIAAGAAIVATALLALGVPTWWKPAAGDAAR